MRKIFFILVLMVGCSLAEAKPILHFLSKGRSIATYQDPLAVQNSFAILYHNHPVVADTIANEISEFFSHDPKMQMALARAYYANNEIVKARKYIAKTLALDPNFAPAYVLEGDIFGVTNVDSATVYYNRAILTDPKKPEGYVRYAQVMASRDIELARARLEDLRKVCPDYPVDIEIAGLYNNRGEDDDAAKAWSKLDPYALSMNQLIQYGQNLYWAKDKDDARGMEIAQIGIQRFPQKYGFSRLYLWFATRHGEYAKALKEGKVWFEHTSNDSINSIDLYCMGACYLGLKSTAESLNSEVDSAFHYFAQIPSKKDQFASQMDGMITLLVNKLVVDKEKANDYDGAIAMYKKYMEAYPSKNNAAGQLYDFADIYRVKATSLSESLDLNPSSLDLKAERDATARELFNLYDEYERKYASTENYKYILYYHANMLYAWFDPKNEQGLALPYYRRLNDLISKNKEPLWEKVDKLSGNDTKLIVSATNYLGDYYLLKNDLPVAKRWYKRTLKYDPTNQRALSVLNAWGK